MFLLFVISRGYLTGTAYYERWNIGAIKAVFPKASRALPRHDSTILYNRAVCVYFIEILRRLKSGKRNVDRLLDWQSALFGYCSRLKQFKFNQSREGIFACDLNEFRSLTANIIVIVSAHQFGQYARSQVHGSPRLLRTRSRSSTRVVSSRALCGGLNK